MDQEKDINELQVEAQVARKTFNNVLESYQAAETQLVVHQTTVSSLKAHLEEARKRMRSAIKALAAEAERHQTRQELVVGTQWQKN